MLQTEVCLFSILAICCLMTGTQATASYTVNSAEWINFKRQFNKTYTTAEETTALYYFNYNAQLVAKHNLYYDRGVYTYSLRLNQFADLNLIKTLPTRFPLASTTTADLSEAAPTVAAAPTEYDPRVDPGLLLDVRDQGTVCSSGWAYATASAIQLKSSLETLTNAATLSAQQLIDCAGLGTACTTQTPQAGLDYLVGNSRLIYPITEYANNPWSSTPGFCLPPVASTSGIPVTRYSRITDGADTSLLQYVGNGYPVVIEYNPTSYQFMLYGEGVFQQPATGSGSHFMTVVGYGHDTTRNLDFWLVQNSFGLDWGEVGLIRIIRSATKLLAKSAIFPSVLG